MRQLEYISPTSYKKYCKNRETFYLEYLAPKRAPRDKQTDAMSVGSAFDAFAKSHIHEKLFGKGADPQFEFTTIFEKQVEPHNRDAALVAGKHVFDAYIACGALADLFLNLNGAIGKPRFEFDLKGEVQGMNKTIGGVVLLGKPDIYFTNREGTGIIFDWKVNGYYSPHHQSPKPGYICMLPGRTAHKGCIADTYKGQRINAASRLNLIEKDWASQLSIYSWLCGEEVGAKFVTAIDQIVCNTQGCTLQFPDLKIAQHRLLVEDTFQHDLYTGLKEMWDIIQSGHYFREMSREESIARCEGLDAQALNLWGTMDDPTDAMFQKMIPKAQPW